MKENDELLKEGEINDDIAGEATGGVWTQGGTSGGLSKTVLKGQVSGGVTHAVLTPQTQATPTKTVLKGAVQKAVLKPGMGGGLERC